MTAYSRFDKDKNPILVIHDRNNGVFFINIMTLEKTQLLDPLGAQVAVRKSKALPKWRGNKKLLDSDSDN